MILKDQEATLDNLPIMTCWPMDGTVHHPAAGLYPRSGFWHPECRLVPDAEIRRPDHGHALADSQSGAAHFREYLKENRRMEAAVALGGDPAISTRPPPRCRP